MFRVIIAGGRDFADYGYLCAATDALLQNRQDVVIVSGMARGADALSIKYAQERGYKVACYPADWNRYGRAAGPLRNVQMAENADALIAFWDGRSRGTAHMIQTAKEHGLLVHINDY